MKRIRFFGGSMDGRMLGVDEDQRHIMVTKPVELLVEDPRPEDRFRDEYRMSAKFDTELYTRWTFNISATKKQFDFMVISDDPMPAFTIGAWVESLINKELS